MRLSVAFCLFVTLCLQHQDEQRNGFVSSFQFNHPVTANMGHSIAKECDSSLKMSSIAQQQEGQGESSSTATATIEQLELNAIGDMAFRQLKRACQERGLDDVGSVGALRDRLYAFGRDECEVNPQSPIVSCEDDDDRNFMLQQAQRDNQGITIVDESAQDQFENACQDILMRASMNHWKYAIRKLKQLSRRVASPEDIGMDVYVATLEACSEDRLHGARASEPARRVMEEMYKAGYDIPANLANSCIQNSLADGPNCMHDEQFGGIDCALAMVAVIQQQQQRKQQQQQMDGVAAIDDADILSMDTYSKLALSLVKVGDVDDACALLRSMIVDMSWTPSLELFVQMAENLLQQPGMAEKVFDILAFAKASGYELNKIASIEDGRALLATGVIAAEALGNIPLGLRLLQASSEAQGCAPDRGDNLVASHSSASQRAATRLHKRAVKEAVFQGQWKLAVKLLQLMLERSLRPSATLWKNVVICCAKAEKSRKATALLLDWVKLSADPTKKLAKPAISVFNSVINACEICGEKDLTLVVLESMKETHNTDGNIITFNIALKRLAKQGNVLGCEGIIIDMLKDGVEPTVVSYTTAIGACAREENKNPAFAYEWLTRMRSRKVRPNVITYNTALAACLDGKYESTILGSKIAAEMMADIKEQLAEGNADAPVPDIYTKTLARKVARQLRENWREGHLSKDEAKATLRVPLVNIMDFDKTEDAVQAKQLAMEAKQNEMNKQKQSKEDKEDAMDSTDQDEVALEYATVASFHRTAEV